MQNPPPNIVFDQARASTYDKRTGGLAPLLDALHLLIRMTLSELPVDAQVLCVGVGTGSELIELAKAFPGWRFTAVEPAAPMLAICRKRIAAAGFISRCSFHEGYLASLPETAGFDGATCLLVSHFITQVDERRRFFAQIAARLRPAGYLVNADLSSGPSGTSSASNKNLLEVWLRTLRYGGRPDEEIESYRASYGRDVAVIPQEEIAAIIASGGFEPPVLFYQSLLIHGWFARKPS